VLSNAAPENAGWSRNSSKTSTGSEEVASVSRRDRNTSALAGTRRSLEKTIRTSRTRAALAEEAIRQQAASSQARCIAGG
jgi:hypothetical protein